MRAPDGRVEEWIKYMHADGKGLTFYGHDKKSGLKCKFIYERSTTAEGRWKMVGSHNAEAIFQFFGEWLDKAGTLAKH